MKQTQMILVLALLLLAPAVLQAQQNRDRFKAWDKNNDGKLTKDELPDQARKLFERLDANRNDSVTREEFEAYSKNRSRRPTAGTEPTSPDSNANDDAAGDDKSSPVTVPLVSESVSPVEKMQIYETTYAAVRKPPGKGPFPAVIFLHGGLGQSKMSKLRENSLSQVTSTRFLAWGYVTVNATRRKINHDPQDRGVVDDTLKIIEAVKKLPEVDPNSVTLYGGSGGGTLALEMAGKAELAAVVAGEPATIIYMGMFTKEHIITNADGRPTKDKRWDVMNADAKSLYTPELRKHTRRKMAEIKCPVLILHGDQHALKKFNIDVFVPEMKALGKPVELIIYPGEKHGFYWGRSRNPAMPLKANRDADSFFRKHVKVQPRPIARNSSNTNRFSQQGND